MSLPNDVVKPYLDSNGQTTQDGQKKLGDWERQSNPTGPQAPQMPHESWQAYLDRINK